MLLRRHRMVFEINISTIKIFGGYSNDVEVQIAAMEYTELRILGVLSAGQNVGPESSMLKTRGTELQQAVTEIALDIAANLRHSA